MRNPIKSLLSATEGNKLRKKREVKMKKTAPSSTTTSHFRTFSLLIEQATDLVDKSILNEVDNIYKTKLLPIIKSRGYN
ncbi:hypothetical protein DYB32_008046 [Aphanomyces invadans]|uniref:Uncharacterized protein n=1 Tax=Aphanomyces invadans TaxID=157072 RepID=A0A3R7A4U9_9STRA|nr:hypothetical protein DYB32_008046 [Aphanomyces invadans]